MSVSVDFSGTWKRHAVDGTYDSLLSALGQSWLTRKAFAAAPFTRAIQQTGNKIAEHVTVAGLINIDLDYPIHSSSEEANAARDRGEFTPEEAMGKKNEMVAWFDAATQTLIVSRLFRADKFECQYVHQLVSANDLNVTINFIGQDGTRISSLQKFKKA
eukprot:CAMPEP_0184333554 /NCGR_PEP_ID=MMETSP1089-20130417/2526_1 /TAXON_ID=38269 ORGANISM="Gloeochaete wittrockiana, Strain SAG46.84" /NCGR_SAMPLE_ID=MMETSP1089 /ASSEMBLY_ACC=CAM_ASM_000445 /LENGTH=158 /DNA_ID=CAMNT_0026657425 /DNA_START=87 /DNA_END=563 /DNA_ORIENTATION=+